MELNPTKLKEDSSRSYGGLITSPFLSLILLFAYKEWVMVMIAVMAEITNIMPSKSIMPVRKSVFLTLLTRFQ